MTRWTFTQAIGQTYAEAFDAAYDEDYAKAQMFVHEQVRKAMPAAHVAALDRDFEKKAMLPVTQILSAGSGWGALEKKPGGDHYLARLHLGVMLYELGRRAEGVQQWEISLQMRRSPFALRNLPYDARLHGETGAATALMEEAVALEEHQIDKGFSEEFMDLLLKSGQYEKAWTFYQALPETLRSQDRLTMQAGLATVELPEPDFAFIEALFTRDIACIREGDNTLTDLYARYHVRKLLMQPGNTMTPAEAEDYVNQNCQPPRFIDFRMVVK